MASRKWTPPHTIPHRYPQGEYLLLFDPWTDPPIIDVNVSVGNDFSVLKCPRAPISPRPGAPNRPFCSRAPEQVAAGYTVYGPTTLLVLTVGDGVVVFTLDREVGAFVLTQENARIPAETKEFAIQHVEPASLGSPLSSAISMNSSWVRKAPRGKDFNMRWVASMVADVHRIMTRGHFPVPHRRQDRDKGGKLRLMYEANPMAFLVEQAGGAATTGKQRILELKPEKLHQRVPVILGSKQEVERVTAYHGAAT